MSRPPIPASLSLPLHLPHPDLLAHIVLFSSLQVPAPAVRPRFLDQLLFSQRGIFACLVLESARRDPQRSATREFRHGGFPALRADERVLHSISLPVLSPGESLCLLQRWRKVQLLFKACSASRRRRSRACWSVDRESLIRPSAFLSPWILKLLTV